MKNSLQSVSLSNYTDWRDTRASVVEGKVFTWKDQKFRMKPGLPWYSKSSDFLTEETTRT